MPDFSGQFQADDSWLAAGTADEVMARLASCVEATTPAAGEPLVVELGSRLAMRVLGFLTPTKKVPIRLTVETVDSGRGTQVIVHAVTNQGWYAMSASRLTNRIYDKALQELLATLRRAAPPPAR